MNIIKCTYDRSCPYKNKDGSCDSFDKCDSQIILTEVDKSSI